MSNPKQSLILDPEIKNMIKKGHLDLLFVDSGEIYEDSIAKPLRDHGFEISNITYVSSKTNISGVSPFGEIVQGSRDYGVGGWGRNDTNRYLFSGDELDRNNALLMVHKVIRYGTVFRQVCQVLDEFMGRGIKVGIAPPTFAFTKKWVCSDPSNPEAWRLYRKDNFKKENVFSIVSHNGLEYVLHNLDVNWR